MTRALILLSSADRRGAEVTGLALADALAERGHDIGTVALRATPSGQESLDVDVVPGGLGPRGLRWLRRQSGGVDAVVAYGSRTLVAASAVTVGGPPFVYQSIGDLMTWVGPHRIRRARVGLSLRRAAKVVALWDAVAADVVHELGVPQDRVTVIPNGRDIEHFTVPTAAARAAARDELGVPAAARCLVVIGSLTEEKRVSLAIDAARRVASAVLLVVGDGPLRDSLAAVCMANGADVRFLGSVSDVRPALRAGDLVLSTSRTEGLSGSLIEAGLAGLPAVATDVGATSSIVDETTGALVPPTASANDVAEAIEKVLADRAARAAAARARCVTRFDLTGVVDRWEALLADVGRNE